MELEKLPQLILDLTEKVKTLEDRIDQLTKVEPVEAPISLKEASTFLGLSEATVYQKCSKRIIPYCKTGKRLSFFKSELADFVKSNNRKVYA